MSAFPSSQPPRPDRSQRIQQVVRQALRDTAAGEISDDEQILARHTDLLPELARELEKLRRIGWAIDRAEHEQSWRALGRLQNDWAHDRAAAAHVAEVPARMLQAASSVNDQSGSSGIASEPGITGEPPSTSKIGARGHTTQATATPEETVHLPARIARYQIEQLLGEGGFGCVYRAWDGELARHVAIKVPHHRDLPDPRDIETYLTEARVLGGLDHAAIVPVFDAGRTSDGRCFLVSKLIGSTDLAARIRQSRIPSRDAVRIVIRVAQALHYAHQRGIVHRDVKPANILLDSHGNVFCDRLWFGVEGHFRAQPVQPGGYAGIYESRASTRRIPSDGPTLGRV